MTYTTKTISKGFTLVEMLSVLAIFSILTSVVVFNYNKFRSDTILTNMAYEVALSIREAQIYGVSARQSASIDYKVPYGIFIPKDSEQYYLFADTGNETDDTPDGKFSGTNCANPGQDTCVTTYSLQRGMKISDVQYSQDTNCQYTDDMSIVFKRPNPEPIFNNSGGTTNIIKTLITIEAPDGAQRHVWIYNNGQVDVINEENPCGA
jgi:prepilin-type N-terminal cleavage/methylation domain-containing protein